MKRTRIVFQPSGRKGEVEAGRTLLEAAQELGEDLEALCGGAGTCGKCKVRIEEGHFPKEDLDSSARHLSPPADRELRALSALEGGGFRLACAAEIRGDVKVFVPESSRAGRQVVRKPARHLTVDPNPAVKLYRVQLVPPSLEDEPLGDAERILDRLQSEHGLGRLAFDHDALAALQDALRDGEWQVWVFVWRDREILKVVPGPTPPAYGVALDIGSTTVVGYLCDLRDGALRATESIMNPQIPFGEDIMSRISFAASQEDGLDKMHGAIVTGVNQILEKMEVTTGAEVRGHVVDMTVVGNTVMHHLFLRLNPEYIGRSPFTPAVQHSVDVKAERLGIRISPGSYVHVLPVEAGFVGADNVGVLLAEAPYESDETVLLVDIGTNGELLLGNRQRICCTSCATGPAFEGAQIRFGMRAAPGAIERVRIDPETKECEYKVIADVDAAESAAAPRPRGICGSGIIDAVSELFRAGVIDRTGKLQLELESPRVRRGGEGKPEYVLAWADETAMGVDLTVSQADIGAVQLAKGALYAGAKLMMGEMKVERLDRVILAGAFGSYIDRESAQSLGMFPYCALEKIVAVGNAAGDGARLALLSEDKRREAEYRARWVEFLEIATKDRFQKEFMHAMYVPHMTDPFPEFRSRTRPW